MKNRNKTIDLLKGILTISMITAHIIQFFPLNKLTEIISNYINLTTFSGFMFSFGYTSYITYKKQTNNNVYNKKILKNFCKIIIFYLICAISYIYLINKNFSMKELFNIFTLQKIPGYCEFLLSFSFLYIIIYILKNKLFNSNNRTLLILMLLSLLSTQLNYENINTNLIGLFIGTNNFPCFPVIQYLFYFIGGIYFAKNKITFSKKIYLITLICTMSFIIYVILTKTLPNRFPPSLFWILGGSEFIYLYYIGLKKIKTNKITFILENIGKKTLVYLTTSNIIIFISYNIITKNSIHLNKINILIIHIILLTLSIVIPYLCSIKKINYHN